MVGFVGLVLLASSWLAVDRTHKHAISSHQRPPPSPLFVLPVPKTDDRVGKVKQDLHNLGRSVGTGTHQSRAPKGLSGRRLRASLNQQSHDRHRRAVHSCRVGRYYQDRRVVGGCEGQIFLAQIGTHTRKGENEKLAVACSMISKVCKSLAGNHHIHNHPPLYRHREARDRALQQPR